MARFGRSLTTKPTLRGFPPAVVPPDPIPTPPVGVTFGAMSGGRHGRGSPSVPGVRYAFRPLVGSAIVYNDAGTVTMTLTLSASEFAAYNDARNVRATVGLASSESLAFTDAGRVLATLATMAQESITYGDTGTILYLFRASASESWQVVVGPIGFAEGEGMASRIGSQATGASGAGSGSGATAHDPTGSASGGEGGSGASGGESKPGVSGIGD